MPSISTFVNSARNSKHRQLREKGINIMNFLVQKIGELLEATRAAHPYLREISKFHQRVKKQLESKLGPFSAKQAEEL